MITFYTDCALRQKSFTYLVFTMLLSISLVIFPSCRDRTDNSLKIDTDTRTHILTGHTYLVWTVAFSADSETLACVGSSNNIELWDVTTGKVIQTFIGHTDAVGGVAFSSDGKTLATGSSDETIRLWNVNTDDPIRTLEGHTWSVYDVVFSPDGKTLASVGGDKTVRLWDVSTGTMKHILTQDTTSGYDNGIAFSPDGKTLAHVGFDAALFGGGAIIQFWDVMTGKLINTAKRQAGGAIYGVAFSTDIQTVAMGFLGGDIWICNATTGKIIYILEQSGTVNSLAFNPEGTILASGSYGGGDWDKNSQITIKLWNVETGEIIDTLKEHMGTIQAVVFSPDGKTLASVSFTAHPDIAFRRDSAIRLWDVRTYLTQ